MAFSIAPVAAKDGNGTTITGGVDFVDTSGVGTGPYIITKVAIDPAGVNTQTVNATGEALVKSSQSGTWTVQPGNTANTTAWKVDGSAVTQPVSGTVTTTPPSNASTNVAQLAGTTTDTNSGTKSAGTLRVVLATDQPALTNKLLVTPDSVALPANQSVNISQINAVTPLMGNGVTGTGSPRVTIASDNTAFSVNAVQSGTWTVQPGNTANTTAWKVDGSAVTQPVSGTVTINAIPTGSNTIGSVKVTDGTNTMAVKAASTIAAATDPSAVFTLSPNSFGVLTAGTAGTASSQVVTVQGVASMTPVQVSSSSATTGGYSFLNITTDATTVVKSGAGTLHTITVNTLAATSTITVYDNTAGSGTKIATIGGGVQLTYIFDVAFATGLTVVTATAAPDITITYK